MNKQLYIYIHRYQCIKYVYIYIYTSTKPSELNHPKTNAFSPLRGFPPIGTYLTKNAPMYCVMDGAWGSGLGPVGWRWGAK